MKRHLRYISPFMAAFMMILLIMDAKTAYMGAMEGIRMCIEVIIPSLFPFIVVSNFLCASLIGTHLPGLNCIGSFFQLPKGSESLIVVGLLGGYPVGAQLIGDAYKRGSLDKRSAHILLGYCNNAGPAFIFGVISSLFSRPKITIIIWAIHILSALGAGYLLPRPKMHKAHIDNQCTNTLVKALHNSILAITSVCGWVIIFKILITYISLFLKGKVSQLCMITLSGLFELSNGCIQLSGCSNEQIRFLLSVVFLNLGSICVLLQTASVTEKLGLGLYIPGKIIQAGIGVLLCLVTTPLLFHHTPLSFGNHLLLSFVSIAAILFSRKYCKNKCRIIWNHHV